MAEIRGNPFHEMKDQVIKNLNIIEETINECTAGGMKDYKSDLYNQIVDLIDQAEAANEPKDIEIIVLKGKDIEAQIDTWLSSNGQNSFELSWPDPSSL